ncbi:hypothetical protein QFC22_003856 [Naganishia vaughanmartiniae]|uniref:Uncharacterized protein n=1 Tax=Naganishia vaughanmartiniae TaxID=1424756 RepID=A0ACC2X5E5_9TREE|nr:hypothetical protein QFC22_003856 [Naganishia vaughanmartiniae]
MSEQQDVPALPRRPHSFQLPASAVSNASLSSPVSPLPPRLPPRKSDARVHATKVALSPVEPRGSVTTGLSVNQAAQPAAKPAVDQSRIAERYAHDQIPRLDHGRAVEPEGRDVNASKQIFEEEAERENALFRIPAEQFTIPTTPASADPIPQLRQVTTSHFWGELPLPSLSNTALVAFLVVLAYAGISFFSLLVAAATVYYLWADGQRREARRRRDPEDDREKVKGKVAPHAAMREESTEWLNHVLKALFPVITTDVLTPFIDLLEDVMLSQVPPLVSSIRVTEPSLGEEPIRMVSIRPMSDPEWFENLSKAPSAPAQKKKGILSHLGLQDRTSSPPSSTNASSETGHKRGRSSDSQRYNDRDQRIYEVQERRKRDKILRTIGGRRGQGMGASVAQPDSVDETALKPDGANGQIHAGEVMPELTSVRGDENDVEEGNEGQYVNLAVDFSYDGRKNRKGYDLHFLIYMGMGVKGLGGVEVPIWVTMMKITGTVHVRLLLSPDAPFVRNATISMPNIPEFDFSAKPIKEYAPDVIGLPLVKPYRFTVAKSIREVCDDFVRPNSYTLDVDRLLLGQEASLRTQSIGVLHVRVHSAEGLKQSDTIGSSDPYCVASFAKYGKPLWSTRTILNTLNPRWEEDAFILIQAEAIESGERLRLIVFDSDRFSNDDPLGMVSEDLADLLSSTQQEQPAGQEMLHRTDMLEPHRRGMTAKGSLTWSYAFYPIWKLPQDSKKEENIAKAEWDNEKHSEADIGTGRTGRAQEPGLIYQFLERFRPEPMEWENERKKRRLESIAWLTGERSREAMEATQKPSLERRSGVLLFQIHQGIDIELERTGGTFTSALKRQRGAGVAGGPPALADTLDSGAWEAEKLPSSYVEVILNGKLIFRTRTKQLSPQPYWNARAERFIRDFSVARMIFVVRNEKNREHGMVSACNARLCFDPGPSCNLDPILGMIGFDLAAIFDRASQVTRTMPIVGGLGHGLLCISLLFKPLDVKLPKGISGFEVATIKMKRLVVSPGMSTLPEKPCVEICSDVDGITFDFGEISLEDESNQAVSPGPSRRQASCEMSSSAACDFVVERQRKRILAVEYRHSCSLVIRVHSKKKKTSTYGLALLRLADIADNSEVERTLPIYLTDDVNIAAESEYRRLKTLRQSGDNIQSGVPTVTIRFALYTGISRAHKKLIKKDERLRRVYQAWELARGLGVFTDFTFARERGKQVISIVYGTRSDETAPGIVPVSALTALSDDVGDESDDTHASDSDQHSIRTDDSGISDVSGNKKPHRQDSPRSDDGTSFKSKQSSYRRWREESKALHRANAGIMQNGLMRTFRFTKDKVQAGLSSGKSRAKGRHRAHGADDFETEGISQF